MWERRKPKEIVIYVQLFIHDVFLVYAKNVYEVKNTKNIVYIYVYNVI